MICPRGGPMLPDFEKCVRFCARKHKFLVGSGYKNVICDLQFVFLGVLQCEGMVLVEIH